MLLINQFFLMRNVSNPKTTEIKSIDEIKQFSSNINEIILLAKYQDQSPIIKLDTLKF